MPSLVDIFRPVLDALSSLFTRPGVIPETQVPEPAGSTEKKFDAIRNLNSAELTQLSAGTRQELLEHATQKREELLCTAAVLEANLADLKKVNHPLHELFDAALAQPAKPQPVVPSTLRTNMCHTPSEAAKDFPALTSFLTTREKTQQKAQDQIKRKDAEKELVEAKESAAANYWMIENLKNSSPENVQKGIIQVERLIKECKSDRSKDGSFSGLFDIADKISDMSAAQRAYLCHREPQLVKDLIVDMEASKDIKPYDSQDHNSIPFALPVLQQAQKDVRHLKVDPSLILPRPAPVAPLPIEPGQLVKR